MRIQRRSKQRRESPFQNGCLFSLQKLMKMGLFIYRIHVDAVGVGPGVLEILLQPLPQWVGNLVEAYELLDP